LAVVLSIDIISPRPCSFAPQPHDCFALFITYSYKKAAYLMIGSWLSWSIMPLIIALPQDPVVLRHSLTTALLFSIR